MPALRRPPDPEPCLLYHTTQPPGTNTTAAVPMRFYGALTVKNHVDAAGRSIFRLGIRSHFRERRPKECDRQIVFAHGTRAGARRRFPCFGRVAQICLAQFLRRQRRIDGHYTAPGMIDSGRAVCSRFAGHQIPLSAPPENRSALNRLLIRDLSDFPRPQTMSNLCRNVSGQV